MSAATRCRGRRCARPVPLPARRACSSLPWRLGTRDGWWRQQGGDCLTRPTARACTSFTPAACGGRPGRPLHRAGERAACPQRAAAEQEGARLVAAAKQQEAEEKAMQIAKIEAGRDLMATVIAGAQLHRAGCCCCGCALCHVWDMQLLTLLVSAAADWLPQGRRMGRFAWIQFWGQPEGDCLAARQLRARGGLRCSLRPGPAQATLRWQSRKRWRP